uniref:Gram-positive cocci surface proteins LPxTG domain-containing protein n=1 Tax=Winogradskya humida TaxID=113566 RepID=A0ABQ3ZXY8_9ACTN|nr:LPXTG cell wall anchor domain-containing protein [Actinoplanes humidus]GIE23440.1 hypothetical protein Ahu01nite_065420 [Actinoplanes humidus]
MRVHRILGLLVATITAVLIAPGVAHAAPYPVDPPASNVSDGTVSDGGTVTFTASGFIPFERVTITISYGGGNSSAAFTSQRNDGLVLAAVTLPRRATITATADAQGSISVEVPLTEVGTATLMATGVTSGVTITQNVKVLDSDDSDNGGNGGGDDSDDTDNDAAALPTTGPSGTPLLIALAGGLGAILVGAALLFATRSRRRGSL